MYIYSDRDSGDAVDFLEVDHDRWYSMDYFYNTNFVWPISEIFKVECNPLIRSFVTFWSFSKNSLCKFCGCLQSLSSGSAVCGLLLGIFVFGQFPIMAM